ncbi:PP2C family serine/threonine-protein phosphatase [Pseudosporangium ferrugineum]|uniref:Serine/threonine protein phosphatase PrpC n=1 Tax=Pseudosporangium ferrugineum TaxID=439699 RepID=A0A2T0SJJ2_9ACTN|nr:PP2C family serine/threonine-protein phosphatase [Pseudosporangium ferrugineum]PRY33571.1 serine/threonine protein phosphatase PrpC [Pseudosporangium ferrugineum]
MTVTDDCASCADERAAGAAFCENCGRALAGGAEPAAGTDCPACDSTGTVGADGYCGNCGMLAVRPRDHAEIDAGEVAGAATDRGLRHHRNEDAMWLATRGTDVDAVVCDGVSASFDPDVASEVAAEAAGKVLAAATGDLAEHVAAAITAAAEAVAALAGIGDPRRAASNPACTIVAACVRDERIAYGWVGDSRAYRIPPEGDAEQLTEDDSWATHAIAFGVEPQVAWNDPKAHAITAWLGADAGPVRPRTATLEGGQPGLLVLCSDGLWNYLTEPAAFAGTVRRAVREAPDLVSAARALTAFANEQGGADNTTVVLVPIN